MTFRQYAACLIVVMGAACASAGNGPSEIAQAGTGSPRLVACSAYSPPSTPWTSANRVWVEVTVQPDGSVLGGSGRPVHSRYSRGGTPAEEQAIRMAGSCNFAPIAVATKTTIQVAFN